MIPASPSGRPLIRSLAIAAIATAFDALLLALALGGLDALLWHPRALALLAVWAAGNLLLSLSAPRRGAIARAAPDPPLVMLALLVLPFAAAPLAAFGERLGLAPLPALHALRWAAIGLVALGIALRAVAMARLGPRFAPLVAFLPEHALETHGPYARVRHPAYLGSLVASLGGALAFESALGLIAVALLVPALAARVAREEHAMELRFGDAFRQWRDRTGGLLPRIGRGH